MLVRRARQQSPEVRVLQGAAVHGEGYAIRLQIRQPGANSDMLLQALQKAGTTLLAGGYRIADFLERQGLILPVQRLVQSLQRRAQRLDASSHLVHQRDRRRGERRLLSHQRAQRRRQAGGGRVGFDGRQTFLAQLVIPAVEGGDGAEQRLPGRQGVAMGNLGKSQRLVLDRSAGDGFQRLGQRGGAGPQRVFGPQRAAPGQREKIGHVTAEGLRDGGALFRGTSRIVQQFEQRVRRAFAGVEDRHHLAQAVGGLGVALPDKIYKSHGFPFQVAFHQRGNPDHVHIHQERFRGGVVAAFVDLLGNVHGESELAVGDQLRDLGALFCRNVPGRRHLQQQLLERGSITALVISGHSACLTSLRGGATK